MKTIKEICTHCAYATADFYCNRLVHPACFGGNDKLGSDFKKDNQCPYHKEGKPQHDNHKTLNLWNS